MTADLLSRATNARLEEAQKWAERQGASHSPARLAAECIEIVRLLRESGAAERAAYVLAFLHRGGDATVGNEAPLYAQTVINEAGFADFPPTLADNAALLRRLLPSEPPRG